MQEPKHALVDFSDEEAKEVLAEVESVLTKHNGQFYIHQFINKGIIEANLQILKKVELIPKEEGVPSPYKENGGNESDKTESAAA